MQQVALEPALGGLDDKLAAPVAAPTMPASSREPKPMAALQAGSTSTTLSRRAGALAMLRVVAVEALVLMEEIEVSREESASGSDCSDSLRRDAERCDASELLGALVLSLEMCLVYVILAAQGDVSVRD